MPRSGCRSRTRPSAFLLATCCFDKPPARAEPAAGASLPGCVFVRRFGSRVEQRVRQILVRHCAKEALGRHVAVVEAGYAQGSIDSLHHSIVVVDLILDIPLLVLGV